MKFTLLLNWQHCGQCHYCACKSVVSEGKELISNWPIRFQETHGFSFLIGQFDINSFPSLTTDLQSTIPGMCWHGCPLIIQWWPKVWKHFKNFKIKFTLPHR